MCGEHHGQAKYNTMSKGSLLLVDDDRHVLTSMASWLREQGMK